MKETLSHPISLMIAIALLAGCLKHDNSSQVKTVAHQPGLYLDGFLISKTNHEALFQLGESFNSQGLLYESDFLDTRDAFPIEAQLLEINPRAEIVVNVCQAVHFDEGASNVCLNDTDRNLSRQVSFFESELAGVEDETLRKRKISQALGEAIQLLTLNDRLHECYVESVRKTESFEDTFPEPLFSNPSNLFQAARQLFQDNSECSRLPREAWSLSNCPTHAVYRDMIQSIQVENSSQLRSVYLNRTLLGRRLHYKAEDPGFRNHEKEEFSLYYPSPEELLFWDETNLASDSIDFSCTLSQDCYLGHPLQHYLSQTQNGGLAIARSADSKIYESHGPSTSGGNWDHEINRQKYIELLATAVYLAKATKLEPKRAVAAFEAIHQKPSCEEVANYSFGDRNRRFEYAGITDRDQESLLNPHPQMKLKLLDTGSNVAYSSGSRFNFLPHYQCQVFLESRPFNSYCPIIAQLSSMEPYQRYQKIRVRYAFGNQEKMVEVSLSDFSNNYHIWDGSIVEELRKLGIFPYAKIQIEGLVTDQSLSSWELIASYFLQHHDDASNERDIRSIKIPANCQRDLLIRRFCHESEHSNAGNPIHVRFYAAVEKYSYPNFRSIYDRFSAFEKWPEYVASTRRSHLRFNQSSSLKPLSASEPQGQILRHYTDFRIDSVWGYQNVRAVYHYELTRPYAGSIGSIEFSLQTDKVSDLPVGVPSLEKPIGVQSHFGSLHVVDCPYLELCSEDELLLVYEATIHPSLDLLPQFTVNSVEEGIKSLLFGMFFM